jgi:pSer/pThr/pTyr-binding forkhead associated (FHA) protein
MSVITLTLLHPGQSVPIQNWAFETESTIRIGRAADNEVVLLSSVVSRHHLEIRPNGTDWELVNLGANGTFINQKRISKILAVDGMIFRLAATGPQIQIHIQPEESPAKRKLAQLQKSLSESRAISLSEEGVHITDRESSVS